MQGQMIAGTVISATAFLVISLALFSPGWFRLRGIHTGLFYGCYQSVRCQVFPAESFSIYHIVALALMGKALVSTLSGTILAIIGCNRKPKLFKHSGIAFIIGGVFALASVSTFTGLTVSQHNIPTNLVGQVFGYSFWFAWVGAVLAIAGGALSVVGAKMSKTHVGLPHEEVVMK